jgi:hypothetical protein
MSNTQGIIPGGNELPCGVPARDGFSSVLALGPLVAGTARVFGSMVTYGGGAVGYDVTFGGREALVTAGDTRPNGLKAEWGVLGLVSWELGLVRGPGPALVRRECRLGVECIEASAGGCVPVRDAIGRRPASGGKDELVVGIRGPIKCS